MSVDLGIYNPQQVHQDEKTEESFSNIPAIVIHGDREEEKDDPPPYSEDLNDFQEITTAVVEFSHYQDTDNQGKKKSGKGMMEYTLRIYL